ncbi:alpha/beta hydrolase [Paenibacillus caui]|uniref:alpha/beta hydrolase n=1 Tax=Paenibacillus caui TaxID=2873927 RepID=UPI001CA7E4F5|nr:alpha/beta hydrolase [Paenibacillus caui]
MWNGNERAKIRLWPEDAPYARGQSEEDIPWLDAFPVSSPNPAPVIIVCPGGAYGVRSDHEGAPVAHWLNKLGIAAFVLHYRVAPYCHPAPLLDAGRAIRYIRHSAGKWNMDPRRVGILGFSAGGHLAAAAGTHFDLGDSAAADPVERESSRPDLMVLCYSVITLTDPYTDQGTLHNLLGDHPDPELVSMLSNETQVGPDTPPTFLWHTVEDKVVPYENSQLFASALRRNHVPFALHIYEQGVHGLGLAAEHPEVRTWTTLCEDWLRIHGF